MKKTIDMIFGGISSIFFIFFAIVLLIGPLSVGEKIGGEVAETIDDMICRYYEIKEWDDEEDYSVDYKKNSEVEETKINNELRPIKQFGKSISLWEEFKVTRALSYFSHDLEKDKVSVFNFHFTLRVIIITLICIAALYSIILSVLSIVMIVRKEMTLEIATKRLRSLLFFLIPIISIIGFSAPVGCSVSGLLCFLMSAIIVISLIGNIVAFHMDFDESENIIKYIQKRKTSMLIIIVTMLGIISLFSPVIKMPYRSYSVNEVVFVRDIQ